MGASCTAILAKYYLDDLTKDAMRKACGTCWGRGQIFVEISERTRSLRNHRYGRKNNIKMDLKEYYGSALSALSWQNIG